MSSLELAPGMGLNFDELAVLKGHAEGKRPSQLGKELDLTPPDLKLIEQDIRFKLQAKTPTHMITRAFEMGILRVMCLVLCFSVVSDLDDQALRTRTRTRTEYSRTVRSGREFTC
ncbi:hypothetical protein CAG63_18385 [Vibrio sp. V37_P2S8PM304]|uniref:hypothetical protein n=1 Tax=Vibrio sp. V37_P2S8PM304 TaxID=1938688 RepID=UPI001372AEFB|nr:hypothetical protein [Vibrio sp. V37_P2S8PM304]NAX32016.1 hypothetical protein [Vibrio sp. V37_P2S8PM304]